MHEQLTKNALGFLEDDLNRKILGEYLIDSRNSFREIARRLDIAPGTVVARVNQMEQLGIIEKYTAKINHKSLGLGVTAIFRVLINNGGMLSRSHALHRRAGVMAVYSVTGDSDGVIIGKFKDTEELNKFTEWLLSQPEVKSSYTHVVLTTGKEDFNSL